MAFTAEEIQEFHTEASELLESAEKSLLAIDKGADFATNYDSIFRALHSIKGAAGMMEMLELQSHMHQLENIFTEQKGNKTLDKKYIDFFLKGTDGARSILNGEKITFDYQVKDEPKPSAPPEAETKAATAKAPAAPVPVKPDPKPTPKQDSLGYVVVVDDEPEILSILTSILKDAGLEVEGTVDPDLVLPLIQKKVPNAVISDVSMPKKSGSELLTEISAKYPEIPVIFVSGYLTKEALIHAISSGVYAVIEKPFNEPEVIRTALTAVQRNKLDALLNKSINLIMYQFSDLDNFLKSQGKEDVRNVISKELNFLIEQRRSLRSLKKKL